MNKTILAVVFGMMSFGTFADDLVTQVNQAIFNKTAPEVIMKTPNRTADGASEVVIVTDGLRYTIIAHTDGFLNYYIRKNGSANSPTSLIGYSPKIDDCEFVRIVENEKATEDTGEGKLFCLKHLVKIAKVYGVI